MDRNASGGGGVPEYTSGNIRIAKEINSNGEYCYVFCSSNDIWYPNTRQAYEESIVKKDRYEWTNLSIAKAKKILYLRDIYKSWYVTGINQKIDCIDRLCEYVESEAEGMKLVFIGSSSGGYLAVLLGCLMHADHVICFSGQMELNNQWAIEKNGLLQHYKGDLLRNRYYDLKPYIENADTPIYYIVPMKCEQDIHHYKYVEGLPAIRSFCFRSKHHGVVMSKCNLPIFINLEKEELEKLYITYKGKTISVLLFSARLVGWGKALAGMYKDARKQLKRKFRR